MLTGAKKAKRAKKATTAGRKTKKLKCVAGRAKSKRTCLKDPIDVATGVVLFDQVDLELPGPIPFVWERTWYSNSEYDGPLGSGWHHGYDLALTVEEEAVAVRLTDGRLALFEPPTAANDYRSFNHTERLELRVHEGIYCIFDVAQGLHYCFAVPKLVPTASDDVEAYVLARLEDANGFAIRFAYEAQGRLHRIWDSAGREICLKLDAQGRVESLEAPLPEGEGCFTVVRYQYDEVSNMTAATDALGHAARYAYQGRLMVRKTLRTGLSFYFEYEGSGSEAKCVRTWGDGNILNG